MKKRLLKILNDMIPVVLGILIALFLNNWIENRNDKKFLNRVLTSITYELEENKQELELKIEGHNVLLDTIDFYLDNEAVSIGEIIGKTGGLKGVNIKNSSWKSFINPNIELVDYKVISVMTDIEEGKQNMELQMSKLLDVIYQNISSTSYEKKQIFGLIIGDLAYTEEELLKSHNEFLSRGK